MTGVLGRWEENGLSLTVLRRGEYLSGYVGVPMGHHLHGFRYNQCLEGCAGRKVKTRRGEDTVYPCVSEGDHPSISKEIEQCLTFSAEGNGVDLPEGLWFFGIDFAHSHHLYPGPEGKTPDAKYAVKETRRLARELSKHAELPVGAASV